MSPRKQQQAPPKVRVRAHQRTRRQPGDRPPPRPRPTLAELFRGTAKKGEKR